LCSRRQGQGRESATRNGVVCGSCPSAFIELVVEYLGYLLAEHGTRHQPGSDNECQKEREITHGELTWYLGTGEGVHAHWSYGRLPNKSQHAVYVRLRTIATTFRSKYARVAALGKTRAPQDAGPGGWKHSGDAGSCRRRQFRVRSSDSADSCGWDVRNPSTGACSAKHWSVLPIRNNVSLQDRVQFGKQKIAQIRQSAMPPKIVQSRKVKLTDAQPANWPWLPPVGRPPATLAGGLLPVAELLPE
jgi:hypothetical protein